MTSNQIRAHKDMVFAVTRQTFGPRKLPEELRGCSISLRMVMTWAIRECRLHTLPSDEIEFNLKLDGRPLAGKGKAYSRYMISRSL